VVVGREGLRNSGAERWYKMGGVLGGFRLLLQDLNALFGTQESRIWFILVASLLCQIGYWYLGSPGPQLLVFAPREPLQALFSIGWALVFLLFVPQILMGFFGLTPRDAGLRLGDVRFGLPITLLLSFIMIPLMFLGAQDPRIQAAYPWPGAWPGLTLQNLLVWTGFYSLYYLAFEFFYRGFMLRMLEPVWGLKTAIWVQLIASVLIHLGKPLPEVLAAIPGGLLFAVLAVRSRSLLWPILLHLVIGMSNDIFSMYHQGLLFP
jgi:membrane protease YdiL (CAAX protease family)